MLQNLQGPFSDARLYENSNLDTKLPPKLPVQVLSILRGPAELTKLVKSAEFQADENFGGVDPFGDDHCINIISKFLNYNKLNYMSEELLGSSLSSFYFYVIVDDILPFEFKTIPFCDFDDAAMHFGEVLLFLLLTNV